MCVSVCTFVCEYIYVYVHMCIHMEVIEQLAEVGSLLLQCGPQGSSLNARLGAGTFTPRAISKVYNR